MQQFKRGLACAAFALLVTTSAWSDEDTTQAEQLRILNEGYSLLYSGASGADFERTLLFTLSGGLNQFRHLARVMAEEERSEQRREFLKTAEARMDELYNAMLKLLSERYYVHDTYESAG